MRNTTGRGGEFTIVKKKELEAESFESQKTS